MKNHTMVIRNYQLKQKQNRMLLREIMLNNGFKPYENEWWHYQLHNSKTWALSDKEIQNKIMGE